MAYCDDHKDRGECIEKNREAIAVIEGNNKLVRWLTPIAVTVAIVVVGIMQRSNADSMDKLAAGINRVEAIVQNNAIQSARTEAQVQMLQTEIAAHRGK